MSPETLEAQIQHAAERFNAKDFAAAKALSTEISRSHPKDPRNLLLRGAIEAEEGRFSVARSLLTTARDLNPGDPSAAQLLAQIDRQIENVGKDGYVQDFLLNRSVYMDHPCQVAIETVGRCNAGCGFCPHGQLDRRFDSMDDALFEKIVADLEEIPRDLPFTIFPNVVNEPFMDKKIFDRLETIEARLPNARIEMITNMNVLPKAFDERFWALNNVVSIRVSFSSADKAEYERQMGIDFDRTVANLKHVLSENRRRGFMKAPLRLTRVSDLSARDQAYVPECRVLLEDFTWGEDFMAGVVMRSGWLGSLGAEQSRIPYAHPCFNWLQINIFCDGTVPHCCMDAKGDFAIGDVRQRSVLEIYNDPAFRNLRENLIAREGAYPCNTCALR